jgi:hypothetical protein
MFVWIHERLFKVAIIAVLFLRFPTAWLETLKTVS